MAREFVGAVYLGGDGRHARIGEAAHAVAPWAVVFDDHEVENNWADEVPEQPDPGFPARRAAAFRAYYEKASRQEGVTGENLLRLLESRFDNVLVRLGFAASRRQARQLIGHGHWSINGRRVDIPSYQVRDGDVDVALSRWANDTDQLFATPCAACAPG